MGRTREYDEDRVLSAAMEAFRRKGYGNLSIRDLEAATGLKAGSIYNSFGDKAGLFAAAFAHYNRVVLGCRIAEFAPPEAGIAGLRALFLSLLAEPGGGSFGCLITNTAVEFGGEAAPAGVENGLALLSDTFAARLKVAHLRDGVDRGMAALRLAALYQGILVLVRAGQDKALLEQMINSEFNGLET